MRHNRLTVFALAAVFGLLTLAPALMAQPGGQHGHRGHDGPGFHRGGHPGAGLFHALRQLDLTEAQKEQIHAILEAAREDGEDDRAALRTARQALHDAVLTSPLDEAAIRAAAADLATLEADAAVARSETYNAVYDLLTPEQREELAEIREEAGERREERRNRFRERRENRRNG